MPEVIEVKLRKIGTSLGFLLPRKVILQEHLKEGETVEVALLKRQRLDLLRKTFGITKGARPFKREYEEDRV
ncbi:MAG: AbrB/MazE/SpoVT family DNA-binding domain-containing protein [Candidatus Micrarchaeales archaeon]